MAHVFGYFLGEFWVHMIPSYRFIRLATEFDAMNRRNTDVDVNVDGWRDGYIRCKLGVYSLQNEETPATSNHLFQGNVLIT